MPNADRVWPPREFEADEWTTGDYAPHVEGVDFYPEWEFPEDEGEPNAD